MAKDEPVEATPQDVRDLLRVDPRKVDLAGIDTRSTPGFDGGKTEGKQAVAGLADEISELQERLYAEGRTGGRRRVLLVVQGMDTSGKGGVMRHVVGHMDPQGLSVKAFKAPTAEERQHDFLWRIRRELPPPGFVGVFDRSHYEDVLIGRVRALARPATIERRYASIVRFEERLVATGCTVVKVMLHISRDEQRERLLARLDDPTKQWKHNPGDVEERAHWDAYEAAYATALERTSTEAAPWYVVPADRKWYRNWAVSSILLEHLRALDLGWPEPDFDVAAERARVEAS